jgi:prolyl-tRNA synthetase
MRSSRLYAPTLKENPSDAELVSHQLLTRAGYIRKLAAGVYDYLPLAYRVIRKIEEIIRRELDRVGAQELLMPTVQPAEIWEESGRWRQYGPELLRLKDRKGGDFCLGPTHEEVIVDLVRRDVRSWRQLPLKFYQIQGKFRDEIRPRAGLMRGREFIMKDAYSFDVDIDGADASYQTMYEAYQHIFTRCGLDFRPVEADTGSIGGSRSHEFQVLAESGEDSIVSCDRCDFAANIEQAELKALSIAEPIPQDTSRAPELVSTPHIKSIEDVSVFLEIKPKSVVKTLLCYADQEPILALVRGDHELNELKVKKYVNATTIRLASEAEVEVLFGIFPGFMGPYQRPKLARKIRMIADHCLTEVRDVVIGANQVDAHFTQVSLAKDCPEIEAWIDLRRAVDHDPCPRCEGHLRAFRGIEVGHIFYLGTKYSAAMRCNILDESGRERPMEMGCYGIGVTRVMAAAVEQNYDQNGIIWPLALAPFQVHLLALQTNVDEVTDWGERLYQEGGEQGLDLLYDDRTIRAGGKFKDADLIGIPYRVALGGRGVKNGVAEVKRRGEPTVYHIPLSKVITALSQEICGERTLEKWNSK